MSEFWALVLGAGLATLSGIISSSITTYINNKNTKKKKIEEVYYQILYFCNQLIVVENYAKTNAFLDNLIKIRVLIDMNATKKIYEQFNKVFEQLETIELRDNHNKKINGQLNIAIEVQALTTLINEELKNNGSKRIKEEK